MKNNLEILYEDNHIIVVVKPNNILSQSDNTKDIDMLTIIKEYIKEKYNKPGNVYLGLVHRLDRPVSGVMVFAKTSKAASRLSDQVRTHSFKKKYMAIVYDNGLKDEDKFIDYLYKDSDNSTKVVDKNKGKYSELSYKVLQRDKKNNLALVDIELETGRHHQIRVQFASRNHALYGDQRYGIQDKNQIALHAYKLEFIHPTTKEKLVFESKTLIRSKWSNFEI
ncbi:MAG: RluA family pseudouridine synthase [Firmicutes bacterium]|nr:RluA family pseudouridine synthase [Bacillota bacterium]